MKTKLCPKTLRYIARRLRKTQHECGTSERLFIQRRPDVGTAESRQFFRGYGACAMHEADRIIRDARAIETAAKKGKR